MSVVTILFYVFMALTALAAGAMLFSKNVFKSALLLLVALLAIAALYVLCFAEFLAVAQILVYAGGVLVVIIFGIMLTTKISGRPLIVQHTNIFGGILAGVGLFSLLITHLPTNSPNRSATLGPSSVDAIALSIFSQFSLPFELAGLLLLIALVGAAVITANLNSRS